MPESYDEEDFDNGWYETEPDTTDRPLNLTKAEIKTRLIDRYDADELTTALELTVEELLLDDIWDIIMERIEYLDIYE